MTFFWAQKLAVGLVMLGVLLTVALITGGVMMLDARITATELATKKNAEIQSNIQLESIIILSKLTANDELQNHRLRELERQLRERVSTY